MSAQLQTPKVAVTAGEIAKYAIPFCQIHKITPMSYREGWDKGRRTPFKGYICPECEKNSKIATPNIVS